MVFLFLPMNVMLENLIGFIIAAVFLVWFLTLDRKWFV